MVWCPSCEEEVEVDYNESAAMTCCFNCGRVLEDTAFSSDVTFTKGADGEGELVGQFVGERGEVRGLQRMAGGKVWSMRVSSSGCGSTRGRLRHATAELQAWVNALCQQQ
jgi:transcription factor IIIB subunit 2